jgi:hypothetical protein
MPEAGRGAEDAKIAGWRATKLKAWTDGAGPLRKKYPTREQLDSWMDKQCKKALEAKQAKQVAKPDRAPAPAPAPADLDTSVEVGVITDHLGSPKRGDPPAATVQEAVRRIKRAGGDMGVKKLVAQIKTDFPELEKAGLKVGAKEVRQAVAALKDVGLGTPARDPATATVLDTSVEVAPAASGAGNGVAPSPAPVPAPARRDSSIRSLSGRRLVVDPELDPDQKLLDTMGVVPEPGQELGALGQEVLATSAATISASTPVGGSKGTFNQGDAAATICPTIPAAPTSTPVQAVAGGGFKETFNQGDAAATICPTIPAAPVAPQEPVATAAWSPRVPQEPDSGRFQPNPKFAGEVCAEQASEPSPASHFPSPPTVPPPPPPA